MKTAQSKTADYYLSLRYAVSLKELAPEDGGGYVASIPELGSKTFEAVGDTPQEALECLEEVRQTLIPRLVAEGVRLPEPKQEAEKECFSGNLMIRIPPALHGQLAAYSKRANVSINKLATQYLAQGLATSTIGDEMRSVLRDAVAEQTRDVAEEVHRFLGNYHANSRRADNADPYLDLMVHCADEGRQESLNTFEQEAYVRTA